MPRFRYKADQLERKAADRQAAGLSHRWHLARAHSCRVRLDAKQATCQTVKVQYAHKVTGEVVEHGVCCDQKTCMCCADRRRARLVKRLSSAAKRHDHNEKQRKRQAALLTLTVRHSGSAATDCARLVGAWKQLRSSWRSQYGFSFTFFRALEIAAGADPLGHAHWHVVCWLPKVFDYSRLQRQWRKALKIADAKHGVTWENLVDENNAGNIQIERFRQADGAARYCLKACGYVTKQAFAWHKMEPEAAAGALDWLYGRRQVTASVGFFDKATSEYYLVQWVATAPPVWHPSSWPQTWPSWQGPERPPDLP